MTKKTRSLPALAPEQWDALIDWIVEHREDWKRKLLLAWAKASAPPALHRLRNTHGPAWLEGFDPHPLPGVQYRLIGGPGKPSMANCKLKGLDLAAAIVES
jgi:hypothetical protein